MSPPSRPPRPIRTNHEGSMAQKTAKERWPKLVQNMIDDVRESGDQCSGEKAVEAEHIGRELEKLQAAIKCDQKLGPLKDDGEGDVSEYNKRLEAMGDASWLSAEWLYAECHIYRHVQTLFASSTYWNRYDVFRRQKDSAFMSSRKAVEELSARFMDVLQKDVAALPEVQAHTLFSEMIQIALWGNATDLSLLSTITTGQLEAMQGAKAIEERMEKIVDNDTDDLWSYISDAKPSRIDVVLDNAGFEFLTDIVLAAYLLHAKLTTQVVLHTKAFPWFVSDVTPPDVTRTLDLLQDSKAFPERHSLDPFCEHLRDLFGQRKVQVAPISTFWTSYQPFNALPTSKHSALYGSLRTSGLVIFKGDLNYRKLLGDKTWPYTTSFSEALEDLGEITILALRTNKADVCVGLQNDDQVRRIESVAGKTWVSSGEYAVISFSPTT